MVDGQGEVELQLNEDTQFLETRPPVTPKGRPCVDIDRTAAGSDLAAGQEITVTYEDEDGTIYVRTLTVVPKPCDAVDPPPLRDGAGEPQPAADAGSARPAADVSADASLDIRAESSGTDPGVSAEADADASTDGLLEWIGSLLSGGH
jgi:hypothetical protein